jgi:hypothetical protein
LAPDRFVAVKYKIVRQRRRSSAFSTGAAERFCR